MRTPRYLLVVLGLTGVLSIAGAAQQRIVARCLVIELVVTGATVEKVIPSSTVQGVVAGSSRLCSHLRYLSFELTSRKMQQGRT